MVDTDFLQVYSNRINSMPKLKTKDIADAVFYALETPKHLQIEDITLQAIDIHKELSKDEA